MHLRLHLGGGEVGRGEGAGVVQCRDAVFRVGSLGAVAVVVAGRQSDYDSRAAGRLAVLTGTLVDRLIGAFVRRAEPEE